MKNIKLVVLVFKKKVNFFVKKLLFIGGFILFFGKFENLRMFLYKFYIIESIDI